MNKITIFTPTYNREKNLEKAYTSLVEQTNKDFLWLIIDDGSVDNTKKIVDKWIKEKKIKIEYHKKKNGGKHTAYNYALNKIKTEFVLIALDSDDYLVKDSVEYLYKKIAELPKEYVGITCLCDTEAMDNKYVIRYNLGELQNNSLQHNIVNNYFKAGAVFLFKNDYLKQFTYPEIKNEKFFTEAYTYYQMDKPMIWTNKKICIREFQQDGYTLNTKKLYVNNPKSWYMYNKLRSEKNKNLLLRIKYTIYTISLGILGHQKILKESRNKLLYIILYPAGLFGYLILKRKKGD